MNQQIVKPVSTRAEVIWLLVTVALVVTVSGSVIAARVRPGDQKELKSHQISAFRDLNTLEQGTFNDLYAAAMEINDLHTLEGWPSPRALAQEAMPPFVRDRAWEKRGGLAWEFRVSDLDDRHMALYFGAPRPEGNAGCFLLILRHSHDAPLPGEAGADHGPYEIWHHDQQDAAFPEIVTDPALMARGWKEVAPYKGEEEVKRLKGEIPS